MSKAEIAQAIEADLHRENCNQPYRPKDEQNIIAEVNFIFGKKYIRENEKREIAPFSAAQVSLEDNCEFEVEVKLKNGYVPNRFVIPIKHKFNQNKVEMNYLIKVQCKTQDPKAKGKVKDFYFLIGTHQLNKAVFQKDDSSLLKEMGKSLQKLRKYMRNTYVKTVRIFKEAEIISKFVKKLPSDQERVAIGNVIAAMMYEKEPQAHFDKYYVQLKKRLRFVVLNEKNMETFKYVMNAMQNTGKGYRERYAELKENAYDFSEPVFTGDKFHEIDYFISHSWSDPGAEKVERILKLCEDFKETHGRSPRLWLDVFCVKQDKGPEVEENVKVLPAIASCCKHMYILMSPTYLTRIWCVAELYFREVTSKVERSGKGIFSNIIVQELKTATPREGKELPPEAARYTQMVQNYVSRAADTVANMEGLSGPGGAYIDGLSENLIANAQCGYQPALDRLQDKFKRLPGSWGTTTWLVKRALWSATWFDRNGKMYDPGLMNLRSDEGLI